MSIPEDHHHFVQENGGSDSEASSDEGSDYYQPISAADDSASDSESSDQHESSATQINGNHIIPDSIPDPNVNCHNGFFNGHIGGQNGISDLRLNDNEEEEQQERLRVEAISRAFREDDNRRRAPLGQDNAVRVMEAMRGISFGGFTPDWANAVPEDRWIDQLRRLRRSPNATQN